MLSPTAFTVRTVNGARIWPLLTALFWRVECVRHKLRARSLRLGWHHRSK